MTLDDLEEELRKLPDADFSRLARRLGFKPPVDLQWAQVKIDDGERPVASVEYADGSKQRIDIFAAIRENAMCVGNPIVLIAIHHWQQIIRHRAALTFKDVWENREGETGEYTRGLKEYYASSLPGIASKSLSRISEALIDSARERSISREEAFAAYVTHDGYDTKDTLLYAAFEWLRKDKTTNKDLKLKTLEGVLHKEHVVNNSISVYRVMDFLRSAKGNRHINPKLWIAMRNAYLAWYFDVDQQTVTKYFSKVRTKKEGVDNHIDPSFFHPRFRTYQLSQLGEILLRYALMPPEGAYLKVDEEGEVDEDFGQLTVGG